MGQIKSLHFSVYSDSLFHKCSQVPYLSLHLVSESHSLTGAHGNNSFFVKKNTLQIKRWFWPILY